MPTPTPIPATVKAVGFWRFMKNASSNAVADVYANATAKLNALTDRVRLETANERFEGRPTSLQVIQIGNGITFRIEASGMHYEGGSAQMAVAALALTMNEGKETASFTVREIVPLTFEVGNVLMDEQGLETLEVPPWIGRAFGAFNIR